MATLEDVRRLCLAFPDVREGAGRAVHEVRSRGKWMSLCWSWMERVEPRRPKVENLGVIAIRTPGVAAKETLVADRPPWHVDDPHYAGYPAVLVRLERIEEEELAELTELAYLSLTANEAEL